MQPLNNSNRTLDMEDLGSEHKQDSKTIWSGQPEHK